MKKTIGVYIDKSLYDQLAEIAEQEKRPVSNFVRTMIEREVESRKTKRR